MGEPEQEGSQPVQVEQLLDTPDLAEALESERFKQFLDRLPVAIAVSELLPTEHIVYSNIEFERLSRRTSRTIVGKSWQELPGILEGGGDDDFLGKLIVKGNDFIGTFIVNKTDEVPHIFDAWSNIIEDDKGNPTFRLVALIGNRSQYDSSRVELEKRISEKEILLRELQHRVKNNLQMITALIRLEARNVSKEPDGKRFSRLAGRIEALALLYRCFSEESQASVDLGVYLSQIAAAVMSAHASEGIRLELKVDTWQVSIDVAMPAGLVVNELMTNALKHAFDGREGGTIKLYSVVDDTGCSVIISDDGVGLPTGVEWPESGKLSALIVKSLQENAKAQFEVNSIPDEGTTVTLRFTRTAAMEAQQSPQR